MLAALVSDPTLWRVLGVVSFDLFDASEWRWWSYVEWVALLFGALHILGAIVSAWADVATEGGKRGIREAPAGKLLEFDASDRAYIAFNKVMTAVFTHLALKYTWASGHVAWSLEAAGVLSSSSSPSSLSLSSLWASVGVPALYFSLSLAALYVVYDFFYTLFHAALHHRSVYRFVHKHHHKQCVPFRGNLDAINVHPFEFATGEFNHLLSVHLVALALEAATGGAVRLHLVTVWAFILVGGILASLNHTRFAAALPGGLFQVAYHDVHHAMQRYNYGQYTVVWDRVFGTFRAHDDYDGSTGAPLVKGEVEGGKGAATKETRGRKATKAA